jgi:hypothetical protein
MQNIETKPGTDIPAHEGTAILIFCILTVVFAHVCYN